MKLRTQILLFLLLFGLTPVIAMLLLNMPMAFQQMERFYHDAHLLNLRADFRDLDEQLASRNETVRLLAKLPEPGLLPLESGTTQDADVAEARKQFLGWVNRILNDQFDVTDIYYIDTLGRPLWQLQRNRKNGIWEENPGDYPPIDSGLMYSGLGLDPGRSMYGPLNFGGKQETPYGLYMRLISPIYDYESLLPVALVAINLDIGGLARAHANTLWVFNDGRFLQNPVDATNSAFKEFPGLEDIFTEKKLGLYDDGKTEQIFWVPMFPTASGEPLWVGRRVDPSPLADFSKAFSIRVILLVLALIVLVWLLASSLAQSIVFFKDKLTQSIRDTLDGKQSAVVPLQGPSELHELAGNLNQLAELHAANNRKLQQHARELEESNRYKSEFLANVSHELRTPLNSILLLSKMLRDDEHPGVPQEQRDQAAIINLAGNDLKTLIDNILDLSRIEADRCEVHEETIDLVPLLHGIHEMLEPQFTEKNLTLLLELPDEPLPVLVSDGDKIAQIIKNFLSNALKFTNTGTVTTQVEIPDNHCEGREAVFIHVKDSGIGIPADQQQHIFEAFRQADGSTNRRFGGTGLGLAISSELARILGGRIFLQSEEDSGSTFSLCLPLHHDEELAEIAAAGAVKAPEHTLITTPSSEELSSTGTLEGYEALIITPDISLMLGLTRQLEGLGIAVSTAADCAEAIEHLAEENADLILINSDLNSAISTDEFVKMAENQNIELPVCVSITDNPIDDDRPQLSKPVGTDQLKSLLTGLLGKDN